MLDFVARRYGVLPHALLDLTVPQWSIAARAALAGAKAEEAARRAARGGGR